MKQWLFEAWVPTTRHSPSCSIVAVPVDRENLLVLLHKQKVLTVGLVLVTLITFGRS